MEVCRIVGFLMLGFFCVGGNAEVNRKLASIPENPNTLGAKNETEEVI